MGSKEDDPQEGKSNIKSPWGCTVATKNAFVIRAKWRLSPIWKQPSIAAQVDRSTLDKKPFMFRLFYSNVTLLNKADFPNF